MTELSEEAGNALLCRPDDVDAMAELILGAIARWRSGEPALAPRPEVVARYERRRETQQMAELIDRVLGGPERFAQDVAIASP